MSSQRGKRKPSKMSGARFIAETLKGCDVSHVFFFETILGQALVEMERLGIRRILTHSEKTAAYMADGYARASRKPGVCMAQSVGSANLASGLQDAYLASSPVIAMSGRKHPTAQYRHGYQEISHFSMFDPVTKFNARVETVEQLPYLLRQAFRETTSGCPAPVHLELSGRMGEITEAEEASLEVLIEKRFTKAPSSRAEPDMDSLRKAAAVLANAKRPVLVAGGGAAASSAGSELVNLAEALSMPVVTSLNGKGIMPEAHPLHVGVVGYYSRWCANQVVLEADLVMYVGSGTGDHVTNGWKVPQPGTPVIQIDINPSELGRNYPNTVGLMGDAKVTLERLSKLVKVEKGEKGWAQRARELVQKWRDEAESLRNSETSPILPERVCKEITAVLPENAILVADTGQSGIWTGTMVYLSHPGQSYIRSAGSLGWAFPASLGAKCAVPDRPVVCFTGDGGLWYHISELETAARWGIETVTVVNNNHSLSQCAPWVRSTYGETRGNMADRYEFRNVSFARIAEEMGCFGIRVESPGDLKNALEKALAVDGPAVVDVVTDPEHHSPPPLGPSR